MTSKQISIFLENRSYSMDNHRFFLHSVGMSFKTPRSFKSFALLGFTRSVYFVSKQERPIFFIFYILQKIVIQRLLYYFFL